MNSSIETLNTSETSNSFMQNVYIYKAYLYYMYLEMCDLEESHSVGHSSH